MKLLEKEEGFLPEVNWKFTSFKNKLSLSTLKYYKIKGIKK